MITLLRYPCWLHWPFRLVSGAVITASALLSVSAHAANQVETLVDPDFGRLTIVWEGDYTEAEKSKLAEWQRTVATVMAGIYGELPGGSAKVVLQRYPASEAVPFARVIRGGNERLLFYVNPDYPLADFVNDWTAYHEYTHLFISFSRTSGYLVLRRPGQLLPEYVVVSCRSSE